MTCSLLEMRCDTENTVSKAIKVFFFHFFVKVQIDKAEAEHVF